MTALTVSELIAQLQKMENQNQRVAYILYTEDDIAGDIDWYDFPGTLTESWEVVVDELQDEFDSEYLVEILNLNLREITEKHFPLKS